MGTKSNRSSGTQHNPKGVTQGVTLVDPKSGNPVDTITDSNGIRRIAVDGNFFAQNVQATVELDYNEDSVQIGDPNTGATLKVNPNGSIDANIESDAADGDSIAVVGTEDGTPGGTQHTLKIGAEGDARVKDTEAISELQDIESDIENTNTILQTEFDDTQTLLQTEFDQTQTAIANLQTEVDTTNYTMNEAFNKAQAIAGQLDDVSTTAATENNIAPVRITAQRALHSNLRDASGNELTNTASGNKRRLDTSDDGVYNATNNIDPANIGLVLQTRNVTADDSRQVERQTAKRGTTNTDTVSADVSLHDENGNAYTALNPLSKGYVSTLNSTTVTLTANSVFTGTFEEVKDFAFFSFSIISDQASATNGLEFQWSSDGVNVDRTETTNLLANTGRAFAIGIRARYFRIKYTNGAVNQTSFRLNTVYHPNGAGIITKPLKGSVTEENFAELVQAPVMAKLKDGNYANIAGISLNGTGILGVGDATAILGNEGSSFKVSTDRLSTGNTNQSPYLLIDNPSGSGKIIRLDKLTFLGPVDIAGSVTYRIYIGPTVTANGTLLTEIGNRQTGQATGVGNFYTLPTVSANGAFNFIISVSGSAPPFVYDLEHGTLIESGFKMLITAQQTKSSNAGAINVDYSETST